MALAEKELKFFSKPLDDNVMASSVTFKPILYLYICLSIYLSMDGWMDGWMDGEIDR